MGKIEIIFKDDGTTQLSIDDCSLYQILEASKMLEGVVINELTSKSSTDMKLLMIGLETILLPFSDEAKEHFDQELALKSLPISLKGLVDYYKNR